MKSFTAGQIPSELGQQLIEELQKSQCGNEHWKYYAGVSYRNLLIYRSRGKEAPFNKETQTTPPHDLTGQPIEAGLPQGPGSDVLLEMMQQSKDLFAKVAANQDRTAQGELPATQTWLWGEGWAPELPSFQDKFGKSGAVITAVDLLRGMGRLLGWSVVEVPGATGYTDTDYVAKGQYAMKTLNDVDFVVVHVEATDEASHEGDAAAKVTALERIDADIVAPLHEYLKKQGDYRLLVSPDHPTFIRTRTHSHGYVPFTICGSGITADSAQEYNEVEAAGSSLAIPGHEIMQHLFQ